MAKDEFIEGLIKVGLVLGSVWLGSEIVKSLSREDKGDDNVAGTQPSY